VRFSLVACLPLLLTTIGCNTLTGVNDLEELPCTVDCVETDAAVDSATADTTLDVAAETQDAKADTGCTLNRDCDDHDDCTRDTCNLAAGTCSSTKVDGDGDGESPSALGACGLDCDDSNKDVFSKQTSFFSVPYLDSVGVSSYDYDCNGIEEKQHDALAKCMYSAPGKCTFAEGWSGSVPVCGALGTYITGCMYAGFGACQPVSAKTKQACR